jgi:hypothetical protein
MAPKEEGRLPLELAAQSAYRAHAQVRDALNLLVLPWDQLPEQSQGVWLRAAAWLDEEWKRLDGLRWAEVLAVVDETLFGPRANVERTPAERMAWEAGLRHLARLLDDPEAAGELDDLEAAWGAWARSRQALTPGGV